MFGELPEIGDRDACTVTFSWLKSKFGELLDDASEELVARHARAYIMMLPSTSLFGDKTAARAHVRWLLFLERIDELGRGGSPSQALLDELSSPGFQQMLSDILLPHDSGYRPDFDATQFDGSQFHVDLNGPVSGPSHAFMALGRTP
ncbi:hypothetical protein PIB30_017196 [Stylosanthes scabra]|uniref:Uncharacterized protein n=1 Tax=Stylosanthes scabra TaxID=79078 RepID=A0ABU6X526_9FABA|nr:hypothetical protein [Stylosanthes scabra]